MSNDAPLSTRRALVLGSGAILGAYWESGLLRGLADGGVNVHDFDTIVGTSAGALVATALASGRTPESPDATRARHRSIGRSPEPSFPFDPSTLDAELVMRVFGLWGSMQWSNVDECAAIGALARQNDGRHAAAWLADFETRLSTCDWGERKMLLVAVDAVSGERRVFCGGDRLALPKVVAASCAVPGICPPVEIEGSFYMDGAVHSSTNADVLVAERPAQVLIAMPTNAVTSGLGGLAERMLEREIAALHAIGCDVRVATPSAGDAQRFGSQLMDFSRVDDAYAVGLDAGREWAIALRTDPVLCRR